MSNPTINEIRDTIAGIACARCPECTEEHRPRCMAMYEEESMALYREFVSQYKDAAEFEARVAEKLALPRNKIRPFCSQYHTPENRQALLSVSYGRLEYYSVINCPPNHDPMHCAGPMCILRIARLQVEQEMDEEES